MRQRTGFSFLALISTTTLVLSLGTMTTRAADPAPLTKDDLTKALEPIITTQTAQSKQLDALTKTQADITKLLGKVVALQAGLTKTQQAGKNLQPPPPDPALKQQQDDLNTQKADLAKREANYHAAERDFRDSLIKMIADLNKKMDQRIDNLLIRLATNPCHHHAGGTATCEHKCSSPHECPHSCHPHTSPSCAPVHGYPAVRR